MKIDINNVLKDMEKLDDVNNFSIFWADYKNKNNYQSFLMLLYNSLFEFFFWRTTAYKPPTKTKIESLEEIDKHYGLSNIYNFIKNKKVYIINSPRSKIFILKDNKIVKKNIEVKDYDIELKNIDINKITFFYTINMYDVRFVQIEEKYFSFNEKKLLKKIRKLKLKKIDKV